MCWARRGAAGPESSRDARPLRNSSHPDEVPGAFPAVRPYGDLVYLEARGNKPFGDGTVRTGGPHAEYAFGPERAVNDVQSGLRVEPVITLLGQSLRAVVDVQQDGIERRPSRPQKEGDIHLLYGDSLIPAWITGVTPMSL